MLLSKQKKAQNSEGNRMLVTINVIESSGPLRFVVNEEQLVASVIDMALKSYAREGRLPVLGSNLNDFLLYCPASGTDALSPFETIGAYGARNFLLCKMPQPEKAETKSTTKIPRRVRHGSFKSWINKTLNRKISSY
ncbi:unnamed protein product [Amaranthus hypochondriacus]